jgi:hypothetical protein
MFIVREAKSSTPRAATPTPGREAATAAALRTHARTPYTWNLRWVHNVHLKNVMVKSAIDKKASCRGWSTGTSPARRIPVRSCRGSLLRRTRCGIRWSAVTQRRAALCASGRNYWPSLSCEAGLGQLEPLRAQLQHGASSAWSAVEYENLDGLLGNSSVK